MEQTLEKFVSARKDADAVRLRCIEAASRMVCGASAKPERVATLAIELAGRFEKYVREGTAP